MLEENIDKIFLELNTKDLDKLLEIKSDYKYNLDRSRSFDCRNCTLCDFRYSLIETYLLNQYGQIQNRRQDKIKIKAQNMINKIYTK